MNCDITAYGAVPDGRTVCTKFIQAAIDDCAARGGGQVRIPAGSFLSGSLRLRSHIDFHLESGARLISSLDPADMIDFLKDMEDDNADTGWEGGCFLFAMHEEHLSISGPGIIDGQGRRVFRDDDEEDGPHECPMAVRGFRPRMSFLEDVRNLTVRDITFLDSAFWTLHMAGCRNVLIDGVRILNNERGPNNDGIDPDCCRNVIIRDCIIRTGDDCIVVKTTAPMSRRYGESLNLSISGCVLKSCSCALKIGTETWADIHHITLSDCILEDCTRGIGIFSRDGGRIHDILIHHVTGNTRRHADCTNRQSGVWYWWGKGDPFFLSATAREGVSRLPGPIEQVRLDHVYLDCEGAAMIAGEEDTPIREISLADCRFTLRLQSAQPPDCLDERPSARGCYPHEVPCLYLRSAFDVDAKEELFRIDSSMQPYIHRIILRESEDKMIRPMSDHLSPNCC